MKLDYQKIKDEFPKALQSFEDWMENKLSENGMLDILIKREADGKRSAKEVVQKYAAFAIKMDSPRHLYDFFDFKGVRLWVKVFGKMWRNCIGEEELFQLFNTREEAELELFMEGFKRLNEQI